MGLGGIKYDGYRLRRPTGIFVAPYEQGEIGPDLFRAVCGMGLEGLVSKRRDRAYRGGRCNDWIKVKNPNSPAKDHVRRDARHERAAC
jgi:bifunctional non-homologous end joining protein LigD